LIVPETITQSTVPECSLVKFLLPCLRIAPKLGVSTISLFQEPASAVVLDGPLYNGLHRLASGSCKVAK